MICIKYINHCQSTASASHEKLQFCEHKSGQNIHIHIKLGLEIGSAKILLGIENLKYSSVLTPEM